MLSYEEIMAQLKTLGNENTARVLMNHGAGPICYGVKIEDLKKIFKQTKTQHDLAMALYNSGVYDAMYLAGYVMDGKTMTQSELMSWAQSSPGSAISSYTVPWVALESPFGYELSLEWITSNQEKMVISGWCILANYVCITPDDQMDMKELSRLLELVVLTILSTSNDVRQAMNSFLISVGCYCMPLYDKAIDCAKQIGKVPVLGKDTTCKIPNALEYIEKVRLRGTLGKKKKNLKC